MPPAIKSSTAALHKHATGVQDFLETLVRTRGRRHALSAACGVHRSYLHFKLDDLDAAIAAHEPALALYAEDARLRAATEPGALGEHAGILGSVYHRRNDFASAKRAFLWALSFRQESLGPLHVLTTATEYSLGVCAHEIGDSEGAEAYFESAFVHEREAGCEARIAGLCCDMPFVPALNALSKQHFEAGRLQRAIDLQQMALLIAERVCDNCFERGDLEDAVDAIVKLKAIAGDRLGAEAAAKRLLSETERRLGPPHRRVGNALRLLVRFYINSDQPEIAEPYERRAWENYEATLQSADGRQIRDLFQEALRSGFADPRVAGFNPLLGEHLATLWTVYKKAPHYRKLPKTFFKAILDWTRANKNPPPGVLIADVIRALRTREREELEEQKLTQEREEREREEERKRAEEEARQRTEAERKRVEEEQKIEKLEEQKREREAAKRARCRKLEERKREREERRRAEEERERAREEAERAERAARDAADREAVRTHVEASQWARACKLVDALLKRSPDDFEARLLRIQCMAGAGQLEAAAQEAEAAERGLAATEPAASSSEIADALRRLEELRRHVAAERRRREEATRRAKEEAGRRAQEERRERERQLREEQERTGARRREEARRREQEEEQRREEQRREEERLQAAEAERQREEARRCEEERLQAERRERERRLKEQREARRRQRGEERRLASEQQRREEAELQRNQLQAKQKQNGKGVCRYQPAAAPEDAECAICFEPLCAGPPTAALSCRHRFEFHGRCIKTWRAEKHAAGCPLCGAPFAGPSSSAAAAAAVAGAASSSSTPARAGRAAGPASPAEGPSGASSSSSPPALQQPASPATPEGAGGAGRPAFLSSSSPAPPQAPAPRRPTRPYQPPGISFA
eukprot:tig00000310_g23971.t1